MYNEGFQGRANPSIDHHTKSRIEKLPEKAERQSARQLDKWTESEAMERSPGLGLQRGEGGKRPPPAQG